MGESYDGHPLPENEGVPLAGRSPVFSEIGPIEAVVVARRYVDQSGNRFRNAVEYDVRDLRSGHTITNVRASQPSFGVGNGQETIYHPATKLLVGGGTIKNGSPSIETDGDLVLVDFIGGTRLNAVIVGALPHASVSYGAKQEDGERRFLTHQGTTCEIDKNGAVEIVRPVQGVSATRFSISADGNVEIAGFSSKTIKISFAGGGSIQIGSSPTDPAILGNQHRATFDELVANVNELWALFAVHVHDQGIPTTSSAGITPTPTPPSTAVPIAPNIATPMPESDLSKVVVLQ